MIKFNENTGSSSKMNSISLYVTTNQIILKANQNEPSSWQDLYRLLPYLRNSLSCVVCSNLLVDPQTPSSGRCHHHLCRKCRSGRKKLKPACSWCRNCVEYSENKSLRILLQCYQQMCNHLMQTIIYKSLIDEYSQEEGAENLLTLIREGSDFHDDYQSEGGIPKSTYNILPCVYTNSSTQTPQVDSNPIHTTPQNVINLVNPTINLTNAPSKPELSSNLYSVMYPSAAVNKITIKRKPKEKEIGKPKIKSVIIKETDEVPVFKRPVSKCVAQPKKGCRCGNATATPGKLTCCGQRCPCYVESKACIECKCRGCRNPHRPDGLKVRPIIADLHPMPHSYQITPNPQSIEPQIIHHPPIDLDPHFSFDQIGMKTFKVVTGNFTGLPISSNLLVNAPILEDNKNNLDV